MSTNSPEIDPGKRILSKFLAEIERRLDDEEERKALKAADFEMIRKLLADNSLTIASVQKGNYGDFAKEVADQFPFGGEEDDGGHVFQ